CRLQSLRLNQLRLHKVAQASHGRSTVISTALGSLTARSEISSQNFLAVATRLTPVSCHAFAVDAPKALVAAAFICVRLAPMATRTCCKGLSNPRIVRPICAVRRLTDHSS